MSIKYNIGPVNDSDYLLSLMEVTRNSKFLKFLFNQAIQKEKRELKKRGVSFPDKDLSKIKKWSTEQLPEGQRVAIVKIFGPIVLNHYRNQLNFIEGEMDKLDISILSFLFKSMVFKRVKRGWEIKTEIFGHYTK